MSRQVTLGSDRLGAGKKNRVELHGFERSNHDLSYIWRSSMAPGTLVPFLSTPILPGDSFDIDLNCNVMTHPTIGPLFGSFKVQLDLFQIPVRLYVGTLHQNRTKIGMQMSNVKMPTIEVEARWDPAAPDIDNSQINPSCILAYLGIRGVGKTTAGTAGTISRKFNAIPLCGYWDIYKQYYANKQEEIGAYVHFAPAALVQTVTTVGGSWGGDLIPQAPAEVNQATTRSTIVTINYSGAVPKPEQIIFKTNQGDVAANALYNSITYGTNKILLEDGNQNGMGSIYLKSWRYIASTDPQDTEPKVVTFPLTNIDAMREILQTASGIGTGYNITRQVNAQPYAGPLLLTNGQYSKLSSQEGLGLKTYQSDILNNWLNDEWIDGVGGVNDLASVSTVGNEFTVEALVLAKKVYDLFNRIAVSDGTYQAYIGAAYDHDMYGLATNPIYEGGLSKELEFQEVVSNSAGEGSDPLGTLGGKGVMGNKHKGGSATIKANEIGWVMGIVSLTPRIDYSQGNDWDVNLLSIGDFHVPNLDGIGFQDLNAELMSWTETRVAASVPTFKSVGKQPAWINYMTAINRTYGNFAIKGNEMFMTLNRNYAVTAAGITDLTTYIDPVKYNQIFAETSRDSQNFWTQIRIGITARRKMSAKLMPNL